MRTKRAGAGPSRLVIFIGADDERAASGFRRGGRFGQNFLIAVGVGYFADSDDDIRRRLRLGVNALDDRAAKRNPGKQHQCQLSSFSPVLVAGPFTMPKPQRAREGRDHGQRGQISNQRDALDAAAEDVLSGDDWRPIGL
jgi:hypothetical protein